MDPAPGLAGGLREHVDEGGGVVVGDTLALVDRVDAERRRADRVELGLARALLAEQAGQLLGRRHLDLPQRLHSSLVGPQAADLGAGVAGDHVF